MEPRMWNVHTLWLALDYTVLRGMGEHMVPRVVQQMLMRFPRVHRLTIERKDDVPQEEGMAAWDDDHTYLYGGHDQSLHILTLFDFRAGKAELALAKAIMNSTHVLWTVKLAYSARRHHGPDTERATAEAQFGLVQFAHTSTNESLWDIPFMIRHVCTTEIEGPNGWCGADLF